MRERYGSHFWRVGLLGFAVLALAFVSTGVALANGVHCPKCDRHQLTDLQFDFWKNYFLVKNAIYAAATLLLAIAIPYATPRRWPFVLGLALAFFAVTLTPR